jgi:hypothetical protein
MEELCITTSRMVQGNIQEYCKCKDNAHYNTYIIKRWDCTVCHIHYSDEVNHIYCKNTNNTFIESKQTSLIMGNSVHTKCNDPHIMKSVRTCIIGEYKIMYDKIRLLEIQLNADIIRHTMLYLIKI